MNTQDEIKALREEIAKLRERIAVLEAKQYNVPYVPNPVPALDPFHWQNSPFKVSC